jgi:hypothetical protein
MAHRNGIPLEPRLPLDVRLCEGFLAADSEETVDVRPQILVCTLPIHDDDLLLEIPLDDGA